MPAGARYSAACVGVGHAGRQVATRAAARAGDDVRLVTVGPGPLGEAEAGHNHIAVPVPRGFDYSAALRLEGAPAEELARALEDQHFVFVLGGAGGGSTAAIGPTVVDIAKACDCFTVVVTLLPFMFEGKRRRGSGEKTVDALAERADLTVVIDAEDLRAGLPPGTLLEDVWTQVEDHLANAMGCVLSSFVAVRWDNVDAVDIATLLGGGRRGRLAWARAEGERAVELAVERARDARTLAGQALKDVYVGLSGSSPRIFGAASAALGDLGDDITLISGLDLRDDLPGSAVEVSLINIESPRHWECAQRRATGRRPSHRLADRPGDEGHLGDAVVVGGRSSR